MKSGAKNSKFAQFEGLPKELTSLLETESDRGAILILSTYLEEILGLIIITLSTSQKLADELLDVRGPAGSFSYKIQICETFGLISTDEAAALNSLRKIRNSAAHFDQKGRGFKVLFDSPQTQEQMKVFLEHLNLKLESRKPESIREIFVTAGRLLAAKLMIRGAMVIPATVPKSVKQLASEFLAERKDSALVKAIEETKALGGAEGLDRLMKILPFARIATGKPSSEAQPSN